MNIHMNLRLTALAIETICLYEGAIVAAIAKGEISPTSLVNDEESVASYCQAEYRHTPEGRTVLSITEILPFPNDARAFKLLHWMPTSTLAGLAEGIPHDDMVLDDKIAGVYRSGPWKGGKAEFSISSILGFGSVLPAPAVREHIALHRGSRLVRKYLEAKDIFQLHRAELVNSWSANIHVDMYGREDLRKIARAFARILRLDFQSWQTESPVGVFNMLLLTQSYLDHNMLSAVPNDGRAFEVACRDTLITAGWQVNLTSTSGDFGGDLVAERGGLRWCIQCKDTGRPAGVQAIQQAIGAAGYYTCDYAAVVSRSGFTDQAVLLAARLKVALLNEYSIAQLESIRI
jgi:hypothetical protein